MRGDITHIVTWQSEYTPQVVKWLLLVHVYTSQWVVGVVGLLHEGTFQVVDSQEHWLIYKMLYQSRQNVVNIVTCLSTTSYPTVRAEGTAGHAWSLLQCLYTYVHTIIKEALCNYPCTHRAHTYFPIQGLKGLTLSLHLVPGMCTRRQGSIVTIWLENVPFGRDIWCFFTWELYIVHWIRLVGSSVCHV